MFMYLWKNSDVSQSNNIIFLTQSCFYRMGNSAKANQYQHNWMPNTLCLLENNFQSPTHVCSSYYAHSFWIPELPLSTLNLPLQIWYMLFLKNIPGTYFSTFPTQKLLKVINSTSRKTLFSMYMNMIGIIYKYAKNLVFHSRFQNDKNSMQQNDGAQWRLKYTVLTLVMWLR